MHILAFLFLFTVQIWHFSSLFSNYFSKNGTLTYALRFILLVKFPHQAETLCQGIDKIAVATRGLSSFAMSLVNVEQLPVLNQVNCRNRLSFGNCVSEGNLPPLPIALIYLVS